MSSPETIVVWDGPTPTDDGAAKRTYGELADRYFGVDAPGDPPPDHEPPTRAIAALVAALLRHWPEDGDEGTPWIEGPLLSLASGPIIEIPLQDRDAVPLIAREAQRLHLLCFDPEGPPYVLDPRAVDRDVQATSKGLRQAVSDLLSASGYERRPRGWFQMPVDDNVCVVVDTGPPSRTGDTISVFVGLRDHRVNQRRADFMGLPHDPDAGATVGRQIGTWFGLGFPQAPGEQPGSFRRASAAVVVDSIRSEAERLRGFASLEGLLAAVPESKGGMYSVATIHLLRGDLNATAATLLRLEQSACAVDDAVCDQYRRFRANMVRAGGPPLERSLAELAASSVRPPERRPGLARRWLEHCRGTRREPGPRDIRER